MTPRYDEFRFPGLPSISELTDASNECRHGRLPFDPGPRCGCWNVGWQPKPNPRRVPRPKYSKHLRRRAVELYAAGESSRQVADRYGASQRQVLVWVRAAGVPVRGRGRPWVAPVKRLPFDRSKRGYVHGHGEPAGVVRNPKRPGRKNKRAA